MYQETISPALHEAGGAKRQPGGRPTINALFH